MRHIYQGFLFSRKGYLVHRLSLPISRYLPPLTAMTEFCLLRDMNKTLFCCLLAFLTPLWHLKF
ncbi:hypothetical protein ZMO1_ZMO2075 [Zymomonas mobilis subsp. mobilis ZM4 = ATCC 31821]|nr:hypothetical protein ZMO1_ZMO2075 [Zymomonas mobilis subsp. mobilis ZM4 = ATCC 31821]HCE38087.1 hypothetical protein [Zymomonas mobilis]